MSLSTESNRLNDVLKWEQENLYSREKVTVLSGGNLVQAEVIGKIELSTPTTGTADGGNTGDGTCTAVTAGADTQEGTYTLECTASTTAAGTVSTPTTGTADGGNTGNGTMGSVTAGASAAAGTYTITCLTAPDTPSTGAATGVVAAGAGNTGDGTIGDVAVGATAKVGAYKLTCVGEGTNVGDFQVVDPDGLVVGIATVAAEFTGSGLTFTIADGSTDFVGGDLFTITVPSTGAGGTWEVKTPTGEVLADAAAVGTAFTSAQLNFTLADGATDFVAGDIFTVLGTAADGNLGTFKVTAPDGAALPNATVATAYVNDQLNFTINDGATDYVAGDKFTVAVAAGSGKVVPINFTAVDGSQKAYGLMIYDCDASSADKSGTGLVRDAIIVAANLVWPSGATTAQKTKALAEMAAKGIIGRTEA